MLVSRFIFCLKPSHSVIIFMIGLVVNNGPHSLGPILGRLVEPLYQQGSNPTVPTIGISTSFNRIVRHVYVYKFMTFALIM